MALRSRTRRPAGSRLLSALLAVQLVLLPARRAEGGPTDNSTLAMDRGISDPAPSPSVNADLFTGSATYAIPIEVPPGTGGMQPEGLVLRYSSAGPRDSWVGSRWTLSLPSIARSLKRGTPSYDDAQDVFTYGGQELALVGGNPAALPAEYRTRRDTFVRLVHETDDSWTVTQKSGTRLRFGRTDNSRIEGPLGTFEWLLESVIDRNQNAYAVTYDRSDPGTAYPQTIRYTLREVSAGVLESLDNNAAKDRRVDFVLEPRADWSESFLAGFERILVKRLARIDVSAAGALVRRYVLRYSYSPDSFRSLLSEVELQGSQGAASPFVTSFAYHSNVMAGTTGWTLDPNWTWPGALKFVNQNNRDEGVRLGDVNGDGLPDLIKALARIQADGDFPLSGDSGVYLNTGAGWSTTPAPAPWVMPQAQVYEDGRRLSIFDPYFAMDLDLGAGEWIWGSGKVAADLTGDGRVDFLASTNVVNPDGDPDTTVFNDANPDEPPDPLIGPFSPCPWFESDPGAPGAGGAAWVERGPSCDTLENPLLRDDAALATLASDSGVSVVLGGTSRFADLDGDGLPEWIVRGTRSILNNAQTECKAGTVATNYVLRNLGGLAFDPAPGSIPQGTITIPASPGGQNLACPSALYRYTPDWQVCDPQADASCPDRLFHSRSFFTKDTVRGNNVWVIKRHLELGNELVDVNVDGLADQVSSYELSGDLVQAAYINDGTRSFLRDDAWVVPYELYKIGNNDDYSTDKGGRFADVNGDGRVDLVVARTNPGGGSTRETYLNDGDVGQTGDAGAWRLAPGWELPENFQTASGQDRGVRLVDVNGDGMVDVIEGRGSTRRVWLNNGSVPDLLIGVENPLGATTSIAYTPSTAFDNTGADAVPDLPQVIPVVTEITVDDGNGVASTTTFSYQDGKYEPADREFRGFGTVTSTRSDGRTTASHFLQDVHNAGSIWYSETRDVADEVIGFGLFTYTTDADGQPPYTVLPLGSIRSDQFGRPMGTSYLYDDGGPIVFGNRTATNELGEVAGIFGSTDVDPNDNRTREFVYNVDASSYLVDRVAIERVRDASGNVAQETQFFYDGASSLTTPPTAGNLTKRVEVLGEAGKPDPTTTYGYDQYGNVTSVTSPRVNAGEPGLPATPTTIEYESTFHAFPSAVVNPLGHRRVFRYAPESACANVTPGAVAYPAGGGLVQVERGPNELANPNLPRWLRCYDAFGRLVYEDAPNGESRLRRVYQDVASRGISRQDLRLVDTAGNEASTKTLIDGLGRAYRVESDGPQGQTIVVDTVYDALGRIASESVPYFLSQGAGAAYVYEYDALDRLTRKSLDGTQFEETFAYDQGWVTSTDANGVQKRRLVDTFGRVAQVEEVSSEGDTTTTYGYDARDLLESVVDDGGNQTLIGYDLLGRRRSIQDPDSGLTTFEYDANGNLVARTNANADVVAWTYDALDRPKSQRINAASTDDVTWVYDTALNGIGRLRSRSDRAGAYQVGAYDQTGRALSESWQAGGFLHDFQTSYTKAGEIASRTLGRPARTLTWVRDANGFLTAIGSGTQAYASAITWDAQGRLTGWTAENGVDTALSFAATHLEELQVNGAVTLEHLRYFYDVGDRVRQVEDVRDGALTRTYGYDDRDRLKWALGPYGAGQEPAFLHYRYL